MRHSILAFLALLVVCVNFQTALASDPGSDPQLTITVGKTTRTWTRSQLLARSDATHVTIPKDVAYEKRFTTMAVPLAALLQGMHLPREQVLEGVALDGYASEVPVDLATNRNPSKPVGYVAIETGNHPWPLVPGKTISPAPFYLVWTGHGADKLRTSLWPYKLAKFISVDTPIKRWPQLAVAPAVSLTNPIRLGQNVFLRTCLNCHTLNHGGAAKVGPDLNLPMNPTEYFKESALRKLIRDPASVRDWSGRHMVGFSRSKLSDQELNQVILYLKYMARHRVKRN